MREIYGLDPAMAKYLTKQKWGGSVSPDRWLSPHHNIQYEFYEIHSSKSINLIMHIRGDDIS